MTKENDDLQVISPFVAGSNQPSGLVLLSRRHRAIYQLSKCAHDMFNQPSGLIKKGVQVVFATLRRIFFASVTAMRV
jgi:hypothetical protein